ncbi:hypothetical protein ADUPG1_011632 [Aduncisulcus paluster]|uniref:Uncharacterized protein n=2 Tax=Aduncisulcus paluster TaxID=2918883 RepID=A0ABQ5JWH2_9EUKA|nr:hypothetical protein ADUPG1_011632 [Aduncisulcus paluster]
MSIDVEDDIPCPCEELGLPPGCHAGQIGATPRKHIMRDGYPDDSFPDYVHKIDDDDIEILSFEDEEDELFCSRLGMKPGCRADLGIMDGHRFSMGHGAEQGFGPHDGRGRVSGSGRHQRWMQNRVQGRGLRKGMNLNQ